MTGFITASQLVAHGFGDYVLQSDWQAQNKTRSSIAAAVHAVLYTVPFALITQSVLALIAICGSHFVIDRWRLARYVVWAKNWLAPPSSWPKPWKECRATGYNPETPAWLATWLLIITDNLLHVLCNAASVYFL